VKIFQNVSGGGATFLGRAITTYWTFHDHALPLYSGVLHTLPLVSGIHSVVQPLMMWTSLHQFLSRVSTRYWYSKSVCPSVRYVLVLYENGLRYCHNFLSYSSPIILVLSASNIFKKFRRVTPSGGTKYRWGIKISRFWTNITLYLANDTRYRQSYYGNLIATHIRSIR